MRTSVGSFFQPKIDCCFFNRSLSGQKTKKSARRPKLRRRFLTLANARRPSRSRRLHLYTLPCEKNMTSGKPWHATVRFDFKATFRRRGGGGRRGDAGDRERNKRCYVHSSTVRRKFTQEVNQGYLETDTNLNIFGDVTDTNLISSGSPMLRRILSLLLMFAP